jgi:hypothetical protein
MKTISYSKSSSSSLVLSYCWWTTSCAPGWLAQSSPLPPATSPPSLHHRSRAQTQIHRSRSPPPSSSPPSPLYFQTRRTHCAANDSQPP